MTTTTSSVASDLASVRAVLHSDYASRTRDEIAATAALDRLAANFEECERAYHEQGERAEAAEARVEVLEAALRRWIADAETNSESGAPDYARRVLAGSGAEAHGTGVEIIKDLS